MAVHLGITIAIGALVITVILQNTERVTTKVLLAHINMPLASLLFLTFAAGIPAGFVLAYFQVNRRISSVQKSLSKVDITPPQRRLSYAPPCCLC